MSESKLVSPLPDKHAITWLFVPGDRPERFEKAVMSSADCIILDLEDAVAADAKHEARAAVADWLDAGGHGWVRINAVATAWHELDLHALTGRTGLAGVMVPKAERLEDVAAIRRGLPAEVGVIALIETAAGVLAAPSIAASGDVDRLAFGSIDYALDISAAEDDESMLLARSTLVIASRAAGLPGPIDGVTTAAHDDLAATAAARRASRMGFAGKLCIHPRQVPGVLSAFLPTQDEIAWATDVLEAADVRAAAGESTSAFQWRGAMIDRPLLIRARAILRRTASSGSFTS